LDSWRRRLGARRPASAGDVPCYRHARRLARIRREATGQGQYWAGTFAAHLGFGQRANIGCFGHALRVWAACEYRMFWTRTTGLGSVRISDVLDTHYWLGRRANIGRLGHALQAWAACEYQMFWTRPTGFAACGYRTFWTRYSYAALWSRKKSGEELSTIRARRGRAACSRHCGGASVGNGAVHDGDRGRRARAAYRTPPAARSAAHAVRANAREAYLHGLGSARYADNGLGHLNPVLRAPR
jgi:hypothetical protein